jgi:acyl carrier protein
MIESNMDNLMPKIQAAFKAAFSIDPASISIETTPQDVPAWDSMGHVALVSSLEGVLGVSFDIDEVMEMEDVRQIARIAGAKLAAKTG